ncbi:MAG: ornithine cyclodeaminase family protein, partial [Candidatus Marinimicrobia bacterium]|nr:ornithine cyclodeaminase family protein [Candidatus Neomarinimicrobiota bacterium]
MALILTRQDVMTVLNMKDCIKVVEQAFLESNKGTAVLPLRTAITPTNGLSLYMPAYLKKMGALACKIVTVYKDNPKKQNLPTTIGKVLLQNPESGEVICIMDGGYLTAVRTGAASGVATKYLARDDGTQVAGIFGAGVQAQMQLVAMCEVRNISKAIVYDVSDEVVNKYIDQLSKKLDIEIVHATNTDEVLKADIICTATSSPTPIFDGTKVKTGIHINGIGSHTPNTRELGTEIIKRSKFIGDSKEACLKEAGDFIIPLNDGDIDESHFYA